ncbi:hypothetical protein ES703_36688 [subsurface metagenome]
MKKKKISEEEKRTILRKKNIKSLIKRLKAIKTDKQLWHFFRSNATFFMDIHVEKKRRKK